MSISRTGLFVKFLTVVVKTERVGHPFLRRVGWDPFLGINGPGRVLADCWYSHHIVSEKKRGSIIIIMMIMIKIFNY